MSRILSLARFSTVWFRPASWRACVACAAVCACASSRPKITIRQIVEAVQGPLVMNDCTADEGMCPRMECCCYHPIWAGAQELLRDYLDSVTLDDVVNHRQYPAVDVKFTDRDRFVEYASCGKVCGK